MTGMCTNATKSCDIEQVELFLTSPESGKTIIIAEPDAGTLIGEMAVISGDRRSASIRTVEPTVLVSISAQTLGKSMKKSRSMYKKLAHMLITRAKETNRNNNFALQQKDA